MLGNYGRDSGLMFSYNGLDKDLKSQVVKFQAPDLINGLDSRLNKNPGVFIADCLRKNSKI
jgi:hypothetical protein